MSVEPEKIDERLATTLIGGFLGAGKTTLLRHILQEKHAAADDKPFKCAVIVNDMAELNIDESLIESTGLIQSEEVIAMQNGCVCCTLQSDLVEQIVELAKLKKFNYLIIEASGVSEPLEIAKLFAPCEDDHDHDQAHAEKIVLYDVARLDTCVTVVDASEFLPTLDGNSSKQTLPQIMVEQIEYSNVIVLNKLDLVNDQQLVEIKTQIGLLNERNAKIVTCTNSAVPLADVIHTGDFLPESFFTKGFVPAVAYLKNSSQEEKSCCKASKARGEPPCCRRARTIDSGKSQVMLASKKIAKTRHEEKYGINSFLYQARRPFHPIRYHKAFQEKYFVFANREDDEEETDGEIEEDEKEVNTNEPESKRPKLDPEQVEAQKAQDEEARIVEVQKEAAEKKVLRIKEIGNVLRSKGCVWMANSHDLQGFVSQAGNMVTVESPGIWHVLEAKAWQGTQEEQTKLCKNFVAPFDKE